MNLLTRLTAAIFVMVFLGACSNATPTKAQAYAFNQELSALTLDYNDCRTTGDADACAAVADWKKYQNDRDVGYGPLETNDQNRLDATHAQYVEQLKQHGSK